MFHSGELPIFLACDKNNSTAVGHLLAAGSNTVVGTKCALNISIRRNDIESARLILMAHPEDELVKDSRNQTPLELAASLMDPSFELLILATRKPESGTGETFLLQIRDSLLDDVQNAREKFVKDTNTIQNLSEFIDGVSIIERALWRFGELVTLQTMEVKSRLQALENKGPTITPQQRAVIDLRDIWDKKIRETEEKQRELKTQVFTPESRAALARWEQTIRERKQFFDELMSKAKSEIGNINDIVEEQHFLSRMDLLLSSLQNWNEQYTKPFQAEIVSFSMKVQTEYSMSVKAPDHTEVFEALKELNTQIAETSPDLINSKSSMKVSGSKSPKTNH